MNVKSAVSYQELSDNFGPVCWAAIPEKHHMASQVSEEMLQELNHLRGTNVFVWMKPTIQSKSPLLRRDGESGNG